MHARTAFYESLLDKASTTPGVKAAAIVNHPPFSGRRGIGAFQIEGKPASTGIENTPLADFRVISPGYFEMLRIPIVEGRSFADSDGSPAQRVAIVNRAFAERYWTSENPIGKRLRGDGEWMTVVGVVRDIRQSGLDQEAAPHVYAPYQQGALLRTGLLVRTTVEPATLVPALQSAVNTIDPDLPIYNVRTMDESIAMSVSDRRLNLILLSVFALTALLLAVAGIYGVLSYSVTQRVKEIGIRMALGAQRKDIVRLIVGEGMLPVGLGLAVGIAGALMLSRVLGTVLIGISTKDPMMFVMVSVLLGIVALLACSIPALRATRIDPMAAVRSE
jgi:predicted permease